MRFDDQIFFSRRGSNDAARRSDHHFGDCSFSVFAPLVPAKQTPSASNLADFDVIIKGGTLDQSLGYHSCSHRLLAGRMPAD
jgi:hypothetical protein